MIWQGLQWQNAGSFLACAGCCLLFNGSDFWTQRIHFMTSPLAGTLGIDFGTSNSAMAG